MKQTNKPPEQIKGHKRLNYFKDVNLIRESTVCSTTDTSLDVDVVQSRESLPPVNNRKVNVINSGSDKRVVIQDKLREDKVCWEEAGNRQIKQGSSGLRANRRAHPQQCGSGDYQRKQVPVSTLINPSVGSKTRQDGVSADIMIEQSGER